jgi:protein-tyrosine phosphatase
MTQTPRDERLSQQWRLDNGVMPVRVLFVCLGNICRSPAAEAAFRRHLSAAGASHEFDVESAGTGSWHIGELPDRRMRQAASRRGLEMTSRARQVSPEDFQRFDYILAMDRANLDVLLAQAPPEHRHKIRLFRDVDPEGAGADTPDPYYGGPDGFDEVLDIVERTSARWLESLRPRS